MQKGRAFRVMGAPFPKVWQNGYFKPCFFL